MMEDLNDRDSKLSAALRQVAREDDEAMGASPSVEARLRRELTLIRRSEQRRRYTIVLAFAASIVVVTALGMWWLTAHRPAAVGVEPTIAIARETTTPFFPLFFGSVPTTDGHLVRMELPESALARFGVSWSDLVDRASGTVLADVLVGHDGLARAVRFVRRLPTLEQNR